MFILLNFSKYQLIAKREEISTYLTSINLQKYTAIDIDSDIILIEFLIHISRLKI